MLKKIIKQKIPANIGRALQNVQEEYRIYKKHRQSLRVAQKYQNKTELKLHLGCGWITKEGWVNIDLVYKDADLNLDLREPLPFDNSSCSNIYSEHFLEHVDYPVGAEVFLKECFRVLNPNGVFSVGVPDTELPLLEYAKVKDEDYFQKAKALWHPEWCVTEMEHINYHFRQDGDHRFAYDYETLKYFLEKIGFVKVVRREFDPKIDTAEREFATLYVEVYKPTE